MMARNGVEGLEWSENIMREADKSYWLQKGMTWTAIGETWTIGL